MAKRSTNFNPRRPRITGGDLLSVAQWLGMTDDEIRAMAEQHRGRMSQPITDVSQQERDELIDAAVASYATTHKPKFSPMPIDPEDESDD